MESKEIVLGHVAGAHGVRGWVKIVSYTQPRDRIFRYRDWLLKKDGLQRSVKLLEGRKQGKGLVARIEGCNDRNQAILIGSNEILVAREALPALPAGEYYWYQLEGLRVIDTRNQLFGVIDHMLETGANDVIVVKPVTGSIDERQRLIPYLPDQVVTMVDLGSGTMTVDWDPEY